VFLECNWIVAAFWVAETGCGLFDALQYTSYEVGSNFATSLAANLYYKLFNQASG
jgi:hypothetical protein